MNSVHKCTYNTTMGPVEQTYHHGSSGANTDSKTRFAASRIKFQNHNVCKWEGWEGCHVCANARCTLQRALSSVQQQGHSAFRKATLTALVKHTKSMALVNPCAESPIP